MSRRLDVFAVNVQNDFKVFFLISLLLTVLRIVFIARMADYISESATAADVMAALYYGARISLKTSGVVMLASFVLVTLPNVVWGKIQWQRLRLLIAGAAALLLCVLLVAKFPYYMEFHTGFNQLIFNALNDDKEALFDTMVEQYALWPRLGLAVLAALACCYAFKKVLDQPALRLSELKTPWRRVSAAALLVVALAALAVFARFGGAFSYAASLHWGNCALTKDAFLNEAILDDGQALYRAYSMKKRIDKGTAYGVDKSRLEQFLREIDGGVNSRRVDDYLRKTAGGGLGKPNKIFIILGESYAQWPLFPEYEALHLADGLKAIIAENNADYVVIFMPNGAFTPMAVNAVVTGLSDAGVYPNYQLESYKAAYATALAPQLARLGYRTSFWYGGFGSWERIRDFVLAQGFDEFHCATDIDYDSGNVWGCDDAFLWRAVQDDVNESEMPTAYVILTVSNHAPYSVDLVAAGFPMELVRAALPSPARNDDELLKRLGHYWYTDRLISDFVRRTHDAYPDDSLFIITGDHADRTNIETRPSLKARYTVPLVIYGGGISKATLPEDAAGGHININATVLELISPAGFSYYALGDSLTVASGVGFNHNVWLTGQAIGEIDGERCEALSEGVDMERQRAAARAVVERFRTIAWWRTLKGNSLP